MLFLNYLFVFFGRFPSDARVYAFTPAQVELARKHAREASIKVSNGEFVVEAS